MPADQAVLLSNAELQTNAFFDFSSQYVEQNYTPSDTADLALYDVYTGSGYALANRDRILSDAIPALTLPVGANYVTNLDVILGGTANFNMQANFENGWPASRLTSGEHNNNWHHSDFDCVAYPYTYQLFNKIVFNGNLH